ncbi:MAG: tetratricopeptide repeat protein [Myxococcota bacterium]|nr:tetratricopeptide repeat protein [Myxococcota bacterium]
MSQNSAIAGIIVVILALLPVSMNAWSEYQDRKDLRLAAKAHMTAGQKALAADNFATGEAAYRAALRLAPASKVAKLGLAKSQAMRIIAGNATAQRNDAIALAYELGTALRTDHANAATYQLALAELHAALGQLNEARQFFEQATSGKDATAQAWLLRGRFELAQRNGKGALEALQHALERNPKNGAAYLALGEAHELDAELKEAMAAYKKATELAPTATSWFKYGETQLLLDDSAAAYQALAKAADLHKNPQNDAILLKRLGVAAYKVKRFDESVRVLTRAAQLDQSADTATNLAVAHQALNDHSTAVAILAKVIGQNPTHGAANLTLVTSLAYLNRRADAHRVGKKFIAFASANPTLKTAATKVSKILEQLPLTAAERLGAMAPTPVTNAPSPAPAVSDGVPNQGGLNAAPPAPTAQQGQPENFVAADDMSAGPPPAPVNDTPARSDGSARPPSPVIQNPVAAEPNGQLPPRPSPSKEAVPEVLAPGDPGIPGRPNIPSADDGRPTGQPAMPAPSR